MNSTPAIVAARRRERIPRPAAEDVRRITCLMLGGIGDCLVCTPALDALRQRYPAAHITLIYRTELTELVENNPSIDQLYPYSGRNVFHKGAFIAKLPVHKCDLWIDLHVPTFNTVVSNDHVFRRNRFIMRCARTRFRLGYDHPMLAPWLTHVVPTPAADQLAKENIASTTAGIVVDEPVPLPRKTLRVADRHRRFCDEFVRQRKIGRGSIVLFFGSNQPSDTWPISHIAEFLRLAVDALEDRTFVLIGGSREIDAARKAVQEAGGALEGRVRNCAGELSLGQTSALIEFCEGIVTTDSGPLHIADALGKPMAALFSSKNYLPVWAPTNGRARIMNATVPCGPCFAARCPKNNECMEAIKPGDVLNALTDALEGR